MESCVIEKAIFTFNCKMCSSPCHASNITKIIPPSFFILRHNLLILLCFFTCKLQMVVGIFNKFNFICLTSPSLSSLI